MVLRTAWQWSEPTDLSLGGTLYLALRPYERDDSDAYTAAWAGKFNYRRGGKLWAFRRRGVATQEVSLESAEVLEALALREMMEEMGR